VKEMSTACWKGGPVTCALHLALLTYDDINPFYDRNFMFRCVVAGLLLVEFLTEEVSKVSSTFTFSACHIH